MSEEPPLPSSARPSGEKANTVVDRERQTRAAKEQMLRVVFSSEARERLSTLRIVKPDLAESVENQIIQLAASGRLRRPVTDEELKQMLGTVQKPKKEFKINWK